MEWEISYRGILIFFFLCFLLKFFSYANLLPHINKKPYIFKSCLWFDVFFSHSRYEQLQEAKYYQLNIICVKSKHFLIFTIEEKIVFFSAISSQFCTLTVAFAFTWSLSLLKCCSISESKATNLHVPKWNYVPFAWKELI